MFCRVCRTIEFIGTFSLFFKCPFYPLNFCLQYDCFDLHEYMKCSFKFSKIRTCAVVCTRINVAEFVPIEIFVPNDCFYTFFSRSLLHG